MAGITKLSVGQALDKLRGTHSPSSKITQLDAKIDALDEEMRLLKATSRRVERDQRAASTGPDPHVPGTGRAVKFGIFGIMLAVLFVILILAWYQLF